MKEDENEKYIVCIVFCYLEPWHETEQQGKRMLAELPAGHCSVDNPSAVRLTFAASLGLRSAIVDLVQSTSPVRW